MTITTEITPQQQHLISESRRIITKLKEYYGGQANLSLKRFETLLDRGQSLRDQLEAEIFTLQSKREA